MIEIALSLAIIGFALVTIVGLLPQGLNTQRDNREDTIISQDSAYYLEAVRGGARGLDFLTNYIDYIRIESNGWDNVTTNIYYSRTNNPKRNQFPLTNGESVVHLLCTLKYSTLATHDVTGTLTNTMRVYAYARALTGSAVQQGAVATNDMMSFSYLIRPEVTRFFGGISPQSTNTNAFALAGLTSEETQEVFDRKDQISHLTNDLYEVRLRFYWPLLPNGNLGPRWSDYRALISGKLDQDGVFVPQNYTPQNLIH